MRRAVWCSGLFTLAPKRAFRPWARPFTRGFPGRALAFRRSLRLAGRSAIGSASLLCVVVERVRRRGAFGVASRSIGLECVLSSDEDGGDVNELVRLCRPLGENARSREDDLGLEEEPAAENCLR